MTIHVVLRSASNSEANTLSCQNGTLANIDMDIVTITISRLERVNLLKDVFHILR